MTTSFVLAGGGGGGKSGGSGGAHEDANTLRSKAIGYAKDLWSSGEIFGFPDATVPGRYIYLNGVPIQNADNTYNYQGFSFDYRVGVPTQSAMFSSGTETPLGITGAEVLGGSDVGGDGHPARPWVGAITETETDAIRLIISIPALTQADAKTGDLHGNSVDCRIEVRQTTGINTGYVELLHDNIVGKCVAAYERSYRLDMPKPGPWEIRVSRDRKDSKDSTEQKQLYVKGLVQIQNESFTYPNSAYAGLLMDAEYFSGSIPKRQYLLKGLKILTPSNYNADTRTYMGVWDGTFQTAWTNNPAWIYYDLLVNPMRGLGNDIQAAQVDKWALYQIAQYNDAYNARPSGTTNDYSATGIHGIPDGSGGFEPRFTFNAIINTQKDAYQVLQALAASFRGITYWGSGTVTAVQDRPKDAVQILAPANVEGGNFNYASSRLTDRHTSVTVGYTNPDDFYKPDYVVAENYDAMQLYGYRDTTLTAIGCTSASQAYRLGKWLVQTEWDETETVTYVCGLDQLKARPGDIIKIYDPAIAGSRFGGRIAESGVTTIGPAGANLLPSPNFPTLVSVGGWKDKDGTNTHTTVALASDDALWRYALNSTTADTYYNFATGSTLANCVAGETLYFSFWARTLGSANAAYFGATFYAANGSVVADTPAAAVSANSAWAYAGNSRVVPNNAVSFRPHFSQFTTSGDTSVSMQASHFWIGRVPAFANNGVGIAVALDAPVNLEGGDVISIVTKDGTLMSAPINFQYGPQTTLILGTPLREAQRRNAMWAIEGGATKATTWRIMRIRESKPHQFEVTATQYDPTKFARIEYDIRLPKASITRLSTGAINPPTNFTYVENLYRANNQVRSRMTASWESAKDSKGVQDTRITGYHIEWLIPGGAWAFLTDTTVASIDLPDMVPGLYGFRVYTQTPFGRSLNPLTYTNVNIVGKSAPPHDVTNFTATPQIGGILLTWSPVTDIDVIGYEVREGLSWDSGSAITSNMTGTSLFVPVTDTDIHTYSIKAIGQSVVNGIAKYSLNAAMVTGQVATPDSVVVFAAQPQNDNVLFDWVPVAGNDIQYEIRSGATWIYGQTVWAGTGTSALIVYPGTGIATFWIKSRTKSGLYCKTPFFAQCTLSSLQRNYILQNDSGAGGWPGAKRNTAFESSTNTLAVQTNRILDGKNISTTNWSIIGVATGNATTAVDGSLTASKYVEPPSGRTGGMSIGQIQQFVAGKTYSTTISIKPIAAGNKRWLSILFPASAFSSYLSEVIDSVTGAVIAASSQIQNSTVTNAGNGWWTITVAATATTTSLDGFSYRITSDPTDAYGNQTSDGVSGMYVDDIHLSVVGEPIFGEYFEDVDLGAVIRARNWLDSDFLMLDTSTLTWATANFAWQSNQSANTSWIASGDLSGGTANRMIATQQITTPTDIIDSVEFNGNLVSLLGNAVLASSNGVSYSPHMARNGLVLSNGGKVMFNLAIPAYFTARCTIKLSRPDVDEFSLFELRNNAANKSMFVYRHADGSFTLLCPDMVLTLPTLFRGTEDYITFVVVQSPTTRTFAAYSQRTNDYQFVTSTNTSSLGPFDQFTMTGATTVFPTVHGNYQFSTNLYADTALLNYAAGGKTPTGYDDFRSLIVGDYSYQRALLGLLMSTQTIVGRPAMDRFILNVDVPNLNEVGNAICVANGYVTVILRKPWVKPPYIQGYQTSGTSIVTLVDVTNVTRTSFQIRLRQNDGTVIAGPVAYQCSGY